MLPVSVVVPHVTYRKDFFRRFCLPSIEANAPAEIIVEENAGGGTGAHWRNMGAEKATQPFVFFCDDDVVLAGDCLERLLRELIFALDPKARYSYCDFMMIVTEGGQRLQDHWVYTQVMKDFDPLQLRRGSICSAMILIERASLLLWDEKIHQLDDWDLTLALLAKGVHGVRVPEVLFHAYSLDAGVTNKLTVASATHAVQAKHGMRSGG